MMCYEIIIYIRYPEQNGLNPASRSGSGEAKAAVIVFHSYIYW